MPTFIVKNDAAFSRPLCLEAQDERHLLRVMRATQGDRFCVSNNQGRLARVCIEAIKPLRLTVESVWDGELPAPLSVLLPLIEPKRMEWAIQKLTELNVASVQLLVTERCQTRQLPSARLHRLRGIAKEAQKQCGRAWELIISPPLALDALPLERDRFVFGDVMAAGSEASPVTVITCLRERLAIAGDGKRLACLIGPEGGFTPQEREWLLQQGAMSLDLGATILRTESAAIVIATLVKYVLRLKRC